MNDSVVVLVSSIEQAHAELDKVALSTPGKAAKQIVEAVRKNKRRALIGPDAKMFDVMSRLFRPVCPNASSCSAPKRRRR